MSQPIVIVGASVRAAATSAIRAGLSPFAADLFGDQDLAALCPSVRVADFPQGFQMAIHEFPPADWMYTGGLENYPEVVEAIGRDRTLLGNSGDVLRAVRDPSVVWQALTASGLAAPEVSRKSPPPGMGLWLRKPLRSSAGLGVRRFRPDPMGPLSGGAESPRSADESWYFQQYVDGLPCSAVYVASQGRSELLGISEQLVGCDWLGANGFQYCGSIGSLPVTAAARATFARVGECLSSRMGLLGLFGVDAILSGDQVWPVEVNPRYTASVEVLERARTLNTLALHVAACRGLPISVAAVDRETCGKAVLFANQRTVIPAAWEDIVRRTNAGAEWPTIADVPRVGTVIARHHPLVTLFATGDSISAVRDRLHELANRVREFLGME